MPPTSRSGGECPKCGSRAAGIMFKCREEGCPRQDEIQEWMLHMDLHLTEHDLPHAGKALRAAWPHVRAYLAGVENERNTWRELAKNAEAKVTALSENRTQEITAKFLEECGYVRKGGARLTFQGGDNIAPTAVEYYNPETGHAVLEFVGVQPVLLEKGKEAQYVKRYLYWAALTQEKK